MRLRIPSQGEDITDHTTQKEQQDVLMRLPDFIQANMQRILDDAVDFAITQAPEGAQLNHKRLRNDIPLILRDIVADLRTPQSAAEQRDKAQGRTAHATSPESAASSHGRSRADDGFGVNQMIAEYRALRASVLRLWAADQALSGDAIDDMMRFNEAIDQAVADRCWSSRARWSRGATSSWVRWAMTCAARWRPWWAPPSCWRTPRRARRTRTRPRASSAAANT